MSQPRQNKKEVVRKTYDWVILNLVAFKKIQLSHDYTFYDLLCNTYNIEGDPIVEHPEYETNGLIAPGYLVPYIRIKNKQVPQHTELA